MLTDKSQGYTEAAFHSEVSKTVFESLKLMEIVEVSITMHTNSPRDRTIALLEAAIDAQKHSPKVFSSHSFVT